MNCNTTAAERASRFVREALLQPAQVDDVALKADPSPRPTTGHPPAHAHGDFGHGDFGHADR